MRGKMYSTKEIKAHMKMEERYGMLSLVFGDNIEFKNQILFAIDEINNSVDTKPFIYDRVSVKSPNKQSICLEFHDDVCRLGGEYFEEILQKLKIKKCEADI